MNRIKEFDEENFYFYSEDGQTAYFDIDQTVAIWEDDINIVLNGEPTTGNELVDKTANAKVYGDVVPVEMPGLDKPIYIRPLRTHVNQVIQQSVKGIVCVAWSASGASWANAVVTALGLRPYIICSLSKPNFYYDDRLAAHFMNQRYYFAKDELRMKLQGEPDID